ncbi:MAG: efflux RND transporter periplasmic adaptor subunit [Candidatus Kapaibacterium sp.]|jgi:HlyD family secretion protein
MATVIIERPELKPAPGAASAKVGTTKTVVSQLKKRKQRRRNVLIVVAVILIALVGLVVVNSRKEKATIVQTEKVSRRTITEIVQATGKIQPEVAVKVSPEISGEVISLPLKEGDRVKKGQVLALIKPTTIQAQVEQAEANLNSTKARQEQAKAGLLNAKQEFNRAEELSKKNLLSQSELDAATSKYQVAQATLRGAQFDVSAAQSGVKQYQQALDKTTVFSPMNGVISSLITQLGEKVVGTSQFTGTEMMTISDLSLMNAEVDVDENDVVNLKIGDKTHVSIDAFPDRIFEGTVIEIANSAMLKGTGTQDQSTNFKVKVRLTDFGEADLRPGMSCTARMETQTKENVLAVPINAVTRREEIGGTKADSTKPKDDNSKASAAAATAAANETPLLVFVVDKANRVKAVQVKTGISDNAYVEIVSGLDGTEEVVKGNYTAVSKELQDKSLIQIDNKGGTKTGTDAKK